MKSRSEALSQAEIEALLATLPLEQEGGPPAAPPVAGKKVRTWDFRKPDKFSKDHLRSLLALHQSFARLAATALSARLRVGVTLRVTSVDQGLYEEYIDLLPAQSVVNVVSLKPLEGNILVEFQQELAMGMLDRLLGGSGGAVDRGHELTDIETALVRNLGRTLLDAMREAWTNLAEVDPVIEEISTSPQLVQVASPADIAVIVLLEVQIGERLGTISICIPHLVLDPLMHRLSAQVWVVSNRRRNATPEMRDQIIGGLRRAGVALTAVLGETTITVDEVLRLQEGDVLLLGRGAVTSARLRVGDQYKFKGAPGLVGGRMAVKIDTVESDDNAEGMPSERVSLPA
jgi:flagellar motor switch protein FliM